MRIRCGLLLLLLAMVVSQVSAQTADLIIHGATVETVDPRYPGATAVAIVGDRIAAVGSDEAILRWRGEETASIDARGRLLIPGFIEGHGHFTGLGTALRQVDLVGCATYDELIQRVRAAVVGLEKGAWLTGRGWDQNLWPEKEFPDHGRLSAATPDHPVVLGRVDGHAALANRKAMEAAGLGADTESPPGGEIIRAPDGAPTGVLIDRAMGIVYRHLPDTDDDTLQGDLLRAQARCFEEGITSFHDAGTGPDTVTRMGALMATGRLRIRLYVMLGGSSERGMTRQAELAPIIGAHGHRLTVRAFKLGVDGALGSRGAALLDDYADRAGHRGLLMMSPKELVAIGRRALDAGYQVCVHAIGDKGNRIVVDAWDALAAERPALREARFRIEHAQILDGADIPRFAELGLVASMQGVHCTSDMPWVPTRIGEERTIEGAYVWRKLLDHGVVLCNGTDAPVEDVSALASFYASVTRKRPDGTPPGGWQPDQRMTRREALFSYTLAGAYAAFEENLKGSITPGKLADLVLLDRNILECEPQEILKAKVLTTIVGGEVVFAR